jgi:TM2 domain-containing membrane protein YozV
MRIKTYLLLALLTGLGLVSSAQSDSTKGLSFGQYLLLTGQYQLATLEFERLYYVSPQTPGMQAALVETNRMNGSYDRARSYAKTFSLLPQNSTEETNRFKKEMILNSLLLRDLVWIPSILADIRLTAASDFEMLRYADNMSLGLSILNSPNKNTHYHLHIAGMESQHDQVLVQALRDWTESPRKSPLLAGALSTFIPGAGKVYAGKWKDGLVSLLFVGANAYTSYRGFSSVGIRSPYGWLFGGLSAGFYLGNIYGSQKAARIYNHQLESKIKANVYSHLLLLR